MHNVKAKHKPPFYVKHKDIDKILYQDYDTDYLISKHGKFTLVEITRGTHLLTMMTAIGTDVIERIDFNHDKKPILEYKFDKEQNLRYLTKTNTLTTIDYSTELDIKRIQEIVQVNFTFNMYNEIIHYTNSYGDIWNIKMGIKFPYHKENIIDYIQPCTHLCPHLIHHLF